MNFKLVISDPKSKKAYQKEMDQKQTGLIGKKIGDKVSGNPLGLTGYEVEIMGGSDRQGFPMRSDVEGIVRKRVLLSLPPGFHPKLRGQRKRKSVRGNTISQEISQINVKVVTYGKENLDKLLGAKPKPKEAKKEEAKEAKPESKAEEKKEAKEPEKEEAKPEEKAKEEEKPKKKEEKPKEEKSVEEKMGVKDLEKAEKETKEKEAKEEKGKKK
ncbi:MAG: 30S ribosomal protein S6e [Candidatus Aenigmatarchaeota archaeon]|nr:MAG: 30S ribosomal protein S6e [Candidatus Aenigmarchaeota archaeon]